MTLLTIFKRKGQRQEIRESSSEFIKQYIESKTPIDYSPYYAAPPDSNAEQKQSLFEEELHFKSIFTYRSATEFSGGSEPINEKEGALLKNVNRILLLISVLILIVFFPFIGWFFVKKIKNDQRLVVFRLGKMREAKAPGYRIVLPIIDQCKVICTENLEVELSSISCTTRDEAILEFQCKFAYDVLNPNQLVRSLSDAKETIPKEGQSCLIKVVKDYSNSYFQKCMDLSGYRELEAQFCETFNATSNANWGVNMISANIGLVRTIRDPPPPIEALKKINFTAIGKQISVLAPFLSTSKSASNSSSSSSSATAAAMQAMGAMGLSGSNDSNTGNDATTDINGTARTPDEKQAEALTQFFAKLEELKSLAVSQMESSSSHQKQNTSGPSNDGKQNDKDGNYENNKDRNNDIGTEDEQNDDCEIIDALKVIATKKRQIIDGVKLEIRLLKETGQEEKCKQNEWKEQEERVYHIDGTLNLAGKGGIAQPDVILRTTRQKFQVCLKNDFNLLSMSRHVDVQILNKAIFEKKNR